MSELPVSNIINVNVTTTPKGISEKNVNSIAIFSHEASNSIESYGEYVSPAQVAADYGTDSLTAQMASRIFGQSPNLRSGNGRLIIFPMNASSATSGDFSSANLAANLIAIRAVASGDLRVNVDGTPYDLTGLRFTNAETWEDVAKILQGRLNVASVTALASGIRITSKKVGTASTVTIAAVPSGTGTAMNGAGYFNGAGGTSAGGANSSGQTILAAIAAAEGSIGFAAVLTTLSLEDAALTAVAAGVQAMDRIFHYAGASERDVMGIGKSVADAGYKKTRIKVYTKGVTEAKLMNAAYAGRGHSVNHSGSGTSQTMNLKQLAGVEPDTGISQALYEQAKTAGVDLYVSYEGVPSVLSTGGNDYFDNVYSDLALKFALEASGFNYLRQTNTKIPQTEQGMDGLKGALSLVMDRFVRNGCLAPGAWNSSETFGDPEVFHTNIETRGHYTYSLPIAQQSPVERQARKAPLVQIAGKRSGAIHDGDVLVNVND